MGIFGCDEGGFAAMAAIWIKHDLETELIRGSYIGEKSSKFCDRYLELILGISVANRRPPIALRAS